MSARRREQPVLILDEQRTLEVPARMLRKAALAAYAHGGGAPGQLSVVVAGDARMRELNREFARVAGTTDVLSFDLTGGPGGLQGPAAEVIVNADEAVRQAARRGKDPVDELLLYVVHGVLHLCGYDDHEADDRRKMRQAERSVMSALRAGTLGEDK